MENYFAHSGNFDDRKPTRTDSTGLHYRSSFNRDRIVHIVDTDVTTVEALSVLFRLDGFQTAFSTEASHFLAALDRRRADVAIINFKVGEDDGLGLLRRVKSTFSGTPVFMVADNPQVNSAVTAMKMGGQ